MIDKKFNPQDIKPNYDKIEKEHSININNIKIVNNIF